ncbi:MAG: J domain-containing protein [Nanoarchaeota archaeon]
MLQITIKGHKLSALETRDSHSRRALKYKNNIFSLLSKIGVVKDNIIIDLEPIVIKNIMASALWYCDGYKMYYSYKSAKKYVDNLYVVYKVIEFEVNDLLAGTITFQEFLSEFSEKDDVENTRKEAREVLGIDQDVLDFNIIDKRYKELAKKYHPDINGGDAEMFKKINIAHKILKRELT